MATAVSIFGFSWAKNNGSRNLDRLNQFGNLSGILTRVLTVFDSIRQVAIWFAEGHVGAGPLTVPVPAKTPGVPQPAQQQRPTPPRMSESDLYIGDPVGKDLGLPPKMTAPAVTIP